MSQSEGDLRELLLGVSHQPWEVAGQVDPRVLVGAAPAAFRERVYLPGDATVHGALVAPDGDTTVVASTHRSAEELWPEYETGMESLGWRVPDAASGLTRSLGDVALAWVFCGEGREVVLVSVMDKDDGVRLRLDHDREYRSWHCVSPVRRPPDQPSESGAQRSGQRFQLEPPPSGGDRALGACRGGGGGGSSGSIPTALSEPELRAHYASQLEIGGWSRVERPTGDTPIVSEWMRDDVYAVLVLVPVPGRPACWHMVFNQQDVGR